MLGELARLHSAVPSYGEGAAPFDRAMHGYMMRSFEPFFRDGPCLQVGCAHGDQTSLLLERFDDLTVLEPTPSFLEHVRARFAGRVRTIEGLLETAWIERQYRTIIFTHVLEHVDDPVGCLRRLVSCLAPGGRLFVAVPNADALSRRIAVKMGILSHQEALSEADQAAGHRRVYRLDTLCRDIRAAGLACHRAGGIFLKPLANFQFNALIGGELVTSAFMEACFLLGQENASACASIFVIAETAPVATDKLGAEGRESCASHGA